MISENQEDTTIVQPKSDEAEPVVTETPPEVEEDVIVSEIDDHDTVEASPAPPPAQTAPSTGLTAQLIDKLIDQIDPEAPRNLDGSVPLIEIDHQTGSLRLGHLVITRSGELVDANVPPGKGFFDNRLPAATA